MPPNGEVYGITGPLRMRVGRSYATEREVYGITGDQWSPLRNERERRKVCRGGHWPPEWKAYEEKGV